MELRMLVAFLLMGGVLFLTPYFYKPSQPPVEEKAGEAKPAAVETPAAPAPAPQQSQKAEKSTPPAAVPEAISGTQEESFITDTDLHRVVFSNHGAVVHSWILKKYTDNSGKLLDLINATGADKAGRPFSFEFPDRKPSVDPNKVLFAAQVSEDRLSVDYTFSDGTNYFRKSFRFQSGRYLVEVSSEVVENGVPLRHFLCWRGGFGDNTLEDHSSRIRTLYYDAQEATLEVNEGKIANDGPVTHRGTFSFAGLEDTYFAAVALPESGSAFELRTFNDTVPAILTGKESAHAGAGFGGEGSNKFQLFVGPKDVDLLRRLDPKLENVVDFGWFGFLAKPLFLSLNYVNDRWVHNYGWSIVLVTVIINFLLLPLKFTSLRSMKRMSVLQPQIAAINAKYKGVGLRDPRRNQQNQEVMDLYKKHGVNPLGGCVPMLLQIPFFFAFFKVLSVAIEMRSAKWLWVQDLSQPEHLAIRVLPIAMIVSQFIMQKMTPTTTADPMQQRIMLLMPLFLGFMFYGFSSGLVLYWLTGNVVGIAQQLIFNRIFHVPAPAVESKKTAKKKVARN